MKKVKVKLSYNPYSILIENGILKKSSEIINSILPHEKYKKIFIITDKNVEKFHYLENLHQDLTNIGYECIDIVLPVGEISKSFEIYQKTAEYILQKGITRSDILIALGGGVIGDLTGFLSATLLRGIQFIQIPTTLLAQVDSSVGGKNAINTNVGKNLIGTICQPKLVLIDPLTLKTLSERDLKAGYTEALKYGLIISKSFFNYLQKNGQKCINLDLEICNYIIYKSCKFKASIVEKDEFETKGLRAILNLGHTFGHAYEKLANYDTEKIIHGEAVGLGMIQTFLLSKNLGFCKNNDVNSLISHFKLLNLFSFDDLKKLKEFKNIDTNNFLNIMKSDKKSDHNQLNLILIDGIGKAKLQKNVPQDKIMEIINLIK